VRDASGSAWHPAGCHLFVAHYRRGFSPDLGSDNFPHEPPLFQRLRVEEFERGDAYLQSGPSEFLLMYQVQLTLANVFRSRCSGDRLKNRAKSATDAI
jgi:hypothetical protein